MLSVVVISFNDLAILTRCLDVLGPQMHAGGRELLVVGSWWAPDQIQPLAQQFIQTQWITAPADENIPLMRWRGLQASRGALVALLEDDCVVGSDWCTGIIAAHDEPNIAIGGAVDPGAYQRKGDWAVYFYEYARFASPFFGPVSRLPGNNVSYKRAALLSLLVAQDLDSGFYDLFIHEQIKQSGDTLLADHRLAVRNENRRSRAYLTRIPYHHGRSFAAARTATASRRRRLLLAALTPGLPLLTVGRIMMLLQRRRRLRGKFVQSLPWTLTFAMSWAIGEAAGYLAGAGNSQEQWR